jgi:hypothetical protein
VVWDHTGGTVTARVRATTASNDVGWFTVTWDGSAVHSSATVRGTYDGLTIAAGLPAA